MIGYSASNYLSLYTSTMGWSIYNEIINILAATGIIYIPFISLLVNALIESRKREDADQHMSMAMNAVWLKIFIIILVVVPIFEISASKIKFTKYSCSSQLVKTSSDTYLNGDTTSYSNTTAGKQILLNAQSIKVPFWWLLWNNVFHGIGAASSASLPCKANIRTLANDIDAIAISDPILRSETSEFHKACWRPAISEYYRKKPAAPSSIEDIATDISWAGSQFFLQTTGYYDFYRAKFPLKSFAYDEARDGMIVAAKYAEGGYPHCKEWWSDSSNGLRKRLVAEFPLDTIDQISVYFTNPAGSFPSNLTSAREQVENTVLREKMTSDKALQGSLSDISSIYTGDDQFGAQIIQDAFTSIGLAYKSAGHYTEMRLVKQLAPVVQSIVILTFIVLLPFMILIGNYQTDSVVALTMFYFSVAMWPFLFDFADWIDAFLIEGTVFGVNETKTEFAGISHILRQTNFMWAIDFLTSALYIALPILLTTLMNMAGSHMGKEMAQSLEGWTSASSGAARAGANKSMKQ